VHFVLQGKGGIGKSYIATILAQYIQEKEDNLFAIDIDQVNSTFASVKALNATPLTVIDSNQVINPIIFDQLMIDIIESDKPVVVDTGANTFSALLDYIVENDSFQLLTAQGKQVIVHTVIAGGDMLLDTANGFHSIANALNSSIVLWLNEHFGPTAPPNESITDQIIVQQHLQQIIGIVFLDALNPHTFGPNIRKMNENRMTFDEGIKSALFNIVEKQRLVMIKRDLYEQLDKLEWPHE